MAKENLVIHGMHDQHEYEAHQVDGPKGAELKDALVLLENDSSVSMLKTGGKAPSQQQGPGM